MYSLQADSEQQQVDYSNFRETEQYRQLGLSIHDPIAVTCIVVVLHIAIFGIGVDRPFVYNLNAFSERVFHRKTSMFACRLRTVPLAPLYSALTIRF